MSRLSNWLRNGPVLTDGAWGTELSGLGLPSGTLPDLWNLQAPDRVEAVARAYAKAGSGIILTNTFRANAIALRDAGAVDQVEEINRAGVALSRQGAGGALVFGSLGPSGMGTGCAAAEVEAVFRQQAEALAGGGADALAIETMTDTGEAGCALRACLSTGLPVVVSFSFHNEGLSPEQAARVVQDQGADAVGANCGNGIEDFAAICRQLRRACGLPIWLKPGAGLPQVTPSGIRYPVGPEEFARHTPALVECGASFLGGCCGAGPAFIKAAAAALGRMV
jgi:5-methyltetrahydrofolate--homocysteine methyltransferase